MHVHSDLINQVCFKQRLRQHTAAHHANIFAFFALQAPHEAGCVFVYKDQILLVALLQRLEKT